MPNKVKWVTLKTSKALATFKRKSVCLMTTTRNFICSFIWHAEKKTTNNNNNNTPPAKLDNRFQNLKKMAEKLIFTNVHCGQGQQDPCFLHFTM